MTYIDLTYGRFVFYNDEPQDSPHFPFLICAPALG